MSTLKDKHHVPGAYLVMFKQLEEESGHGGRDSYEEVNNDEENIGCAGNLKPEGGWIHDGGYGPAGENKIRRENTNITDQTR